MSAIKSPDLSASDWSEFKSAVQFNCAVSDAKYAREYTMCVYLLRMREYYRWQRGIPLGQPVTLNDVGNWVSQTENRWDDIEDADFIPLNLAGRSFDPFDSIAINRLLASSRLVYSAGYGRMGQPHFMLAELVSHEHDDATTRYVCGVEHARDIIALPAMRRGAEIFIRRDGIRRLLWQMLEEWSFKRRTGPMHRLAAHYSLVECNDIDAKLTEVSDDLMPIFAAHEQGEIAAGELLGERWQTMTEQMIGTRGEAYVRAVRDILADANCTWPMIVRRKAGHYLDFWTAGISGIREHLLQHVDLRPLLAETGDGHRLEHLVRLIESEPVRWRYVAQAMVEAFTSMGPGVDLERVTLDALTQH